MGKVKRVLVAEGEPAEVNALIDFVNDSDSKVKLSLACAFTFDCLDNNPERVPRAVSLRFDNEDAKGRVTLVECGHGATLHVNDREVGWFDFYPPIDGQPPQLILDGGPRGDPLGKIVFYPEGMVVVVHKDVPVERGHKNAIYLNDDYVFVAPKENE
jgi:hypothetical protein